MPVLHTKTGRMWLPDALRGLALLNMLAYHAMYDWVYVFGHTGGWYNISAPGCHLWQVHLLELYSAFRVQLSAGPPPRPQRAACSSVCGIADRSNRPVSAIGEYLVRRSAPECFRRAADLPCSPAAAAHPCQSGSGGVCGAVCAHESAAAGIYRV